MSAGETPRIFRILRTLTATAVNSEALPLVPTVRVRHSGHPDGVCVHMFKIFAISAMGAMVVVGAAALARGAVSSGPAGPYMQDMTTTVTSTSSNAPPHPGRIGY
jgi:hypothetical protein